jgi:ubiquinol-cytochrome c reductase cytochrome c1 subunit
MRSLIKLAAIAVAGLALSSLSLPSPAQASGEGLELKHVDWSFNGFFGTFDRASAQRGFQVYKEVCSTCHSLHLLSFRHLTGIGFSADEVKALSAQYEVTAGPNDEGEMFQRPGLPADKIPAPFANDKAAAYANGGKAPPDLSLMAKARHDGPNYIYSLLTGFEPAPAEHPLADGQYYNPYFPGHVIAMAPPLSDGAVTFEDGTPNSVDQMSKDVAQFLMWAAEPKLEDRKQTGIKVMLFLAIFAVFLYLTKRKVWSRVEH